MTKTAATRQHSDAPLLDVSGLTVARADGTVLVDGVSFTVAAGDTLGLVGESGSGKSLTLRAILGLLPDGLAVTGGTVRLRGVDIRSSGEAALRAVRGREIGVIFQDPMTALNPVMRVGDQIAEGPRKRLGYSRAAAWDRAVDLMRQVGIANPEARARAYPHEFSGGMRQRVMIAIALASSPALLLCDEPTTALDVTTQKQVLDILSDLRDSLGVGLVFVTHDLAVIAELCERVAVMYAGRIMEIGSTDHVFRHPQHGYTLGLLRSAPDIRVATDRLEPIPGLPPRPDAWPVGCRFADRCPFATDECRAPGPFALAPARFGSATACIHAAEVLAAAEREPVIRDA